MMSEIFGMQKRSARFSFVALMLLSACAGSLPHSAIPPGDGAAAADTSLGSGDTFEVRVFGEKDMSGEYRVARDGTIDFPLLGTVQVAGKESSAVAQEIAERLRDGGYLQNPHVTVNVQEATSKRISVLGAVAKPGTLPLVPGMTIVQAVSQAGGFTPLASKDDTVVTRRVNDKLQRYRISMTKITRGDEDDVAVNPGDIIFVPERVF
jgi:protein involved in polysaccharide export with SLBB domain